MLDISLMLWELSVAEQGIPTLRLWARSSARPCPSWVDPGVWPTASAKSARHLWQIPGLWERVLGLTM
jgi:hypothetical protein